MGTYANEQCRKGCKYYSCKEQGDDLWWTLGVATKDVMNFWELAVAEWFLYNRLSAIGI